MANFSTLVYMLDAETDELIDVHEFFDLERSTFRELSRELDQIEFEVRAEIISDILQQTDIK